jgi:hypothetical protein
VDFSGDSTLSDVAVVMASLFGQVDGDERAVGARVLVAFRQRQLPDRVSDA